MSAPSGKRFAQLSDLDQWLAERHLNGHWNKRPRFPQMKSYLWQWADIHEGLLRACELVPMDQTPRRTIQLLNPSLPRAMTPTIHLSVQCVLPGEVARAHRHVAAAIRFVIKGNAKGYTVVEGERFAMEEGDLITTPPWTWHDHHNDANEPIMWLDGLDVRLVSYVNAQFQENYSEEQQPIAKPDGFSDQLWGHARPTWMKTAHYTPPYRYRWADTYRTLLALKETAGDPYDGIRLEYTHPRTGGPTVPTFSCEIQLFRPRERTRSHRHTSVTIYQAFRGRGVTVIAGERFEWSQGDIFVVAPWEWHHHENLLGEDSILFVMTDRPSLELLRLYREEAQS